MDRLGHLDGAISLLGPFEVGTEVAMTPAGQDPIWSTIAEIVPFERYADRTDFGGVTLQFSHTLTRLDGGGTRIVHRLEITGPAADTVGPELGPAITSDFPEAMVGLITTAANRFTLDPSAADRSAERSVANR